MKKITVLTIFLIFAAANESFPKDRLLVAVAANFIEPFNEISALFEAKTHIKVEPTFSSTGKLYAQIIAGAPYDLFLSADEKRPAELFQNARAGMPFVYAKGEVVLWTARKDLCGAGDWKAVIKGVDVKRVSIANTETAPYGTAAMTALRKAGVFNSVKDRLVFPQDTVQSFQYACSGSVDAGFCSLSSALSEKGKSGCYYPIKEAPEIIQSAVVLKRGKKKELAESFANFLMSGQADAVKGKYGYR
jgi:molybdate transport system substrate-binding protein